MNSGIKGVEPFAKNTFPAQTMEASVDPLQIYVELGVCIWILGIIALLAYSIISDGYMINGRYFVRAGYISDI